MITNKVLANISHKKLASAKTEIKFNVEIQDKEIFADLGVVFERIQGYRRLFIRLFEDMDKFEFLKSSSVTVADVLPSKYGEINLYKHTMNTFYEMHKISKKEIDSEIMLLIALLHDFGKSDPLCEYYGITKDEKHWVRSSKYFIKIVEEDELLFELDDTTIEIISNTLSIHHESIIEKQKQQDRFLTYLKKADGVARELEAKTIKETV